MTGIMSDGCEVEAADYKGSVVIEWARSGHKQGESVQTVMPGCFTTVHDAGTGRLIPAASATIHVAANGLITADVAVFPDEHGEIIYDPDQVAKTGGVPATFPFLVAEMRVRQ